MVSIFVNPSQFGPNEDFSSYPRTEEADGIVAEESGADLVWYPSVRDIYPFSTGKLGSNVGGMLIDPGPNARVMCGASRPDFFSGVCTVVMRLFNLVRPTVAYFGEKDWQQLSLIQRMVQDFHMDVRVVGVGTMRDADGLAMSTRNKYICGDDRNSALTLVRCLQRAQHEYRDGLRSADDCRALLLSQWCSDLELDYLDFRDGRSLEPVTTMDDHTRLFVACWMRGTGGGTQAVRVRLIDNASVCGQELTL